MKHFRVAGLLMNNNGSICPIRLQVFLVFCVLYGSVVMCKLTIITTDTLYFVFVVTGLVMECSC